MTRRAFITLLGGTAAWPLAARAQQPSKLPTIGLLGAGTRSGWTDWVAAFERRLRELGWVEGRTVTMEVRWAEGRIERGRDILRAANFESGHVEPERTRRCLNFVHFGCGGGISDIGHDRQPPQTGNKLAQNFQPLASNIAGLRRQAGDVAARSRQTRDETAADRIDCNRKDDGDRRCRLFYC